MGSCGLDSSVSGQGQWWAIANTVINIQVPLKAGNFMIS